MYMGSKDRVSDDGKYGNILKLLYFLSYSTASRHGEPHCGW